VQKYSIVIYCNKNRLWIVYLAFLTVPDPTAVIERTAPKR